ncbi:MAG: glycosyltransferase family 4 protein [Nanoarchaeota archaeon]|nr:glycosyltransferase family 4 protein [Nanoarchaeota archaeon]
MKVLMLGWEFPPFFAGGAGIVCYELTKEMVKMDDVDLTYVMPFGPDEVVNQHLRVLIANKFKGKKINFKKIPSLLGAYMTQESYIKERQRLINCGDLKMGSDNTLSLYGGNLIAEVYNFAERVNTIIDDEDFDVVHAHDWTTFPAAIRASEQMKKPLIVHMHITEFDKSGGAGADPHVYSIEKEGMDKADKIITISERVKQRLIESYHIDPSKIEIIYHAKIDVGSNGGLDLPKIKDKNKIVLFAGRMTLQKGADYFIEAAAKVANFYKNVIFVMIGSGDQMNQMIRKVAAMGLQDKVLFHGFYTRDEANKFFSMADVYVMPSVSEPFGLIPLEAMSKETPTIISKQTGASEILNNVLKVDFWDTNKMANQIVSLLKYNELHNTMKKEGLSEVNKLTWDKPARRCVDIYRELTGNK